MEIWCLLYGMGIRGDPNVTPPKGMWQLTVDLIDAPGRPEHFPDRIEKRVPVKLEYKDGGKMW